MSPSSSTTARVVEALSTCGFLTTAGLDVDVVDLVDQRVALRADDAPF